VRTDNGVCNDAGIGLGAVAPTPLRARAAEALLQGQSLSVTLIDEASKAAAAACHPISDVRCSAEYRQDMAEVLTRRCLQAAGHMLHLL
jgi:carbon-monoxide dehydrogenase medium subunit